MQVSERDHFETYLEKLYAGFNMPLSKARSDAYFQGLAKMSLSQFAKCVDYALGENGPEKIPNVPGIWKIRKELQHKHEVAPTAPKQEEPDHLEWFANRLLWMHVASRGGLGSTGTFVQAYGMKDCKASSELEACLKIKRDLIEFFTELVHEGHKDATPAEFVRTWVKHIQSVSPLSPKATAQYTKVITDQGANVPFKPTMARKLVAVA